jgi:hypothetical protein
MLQIGGEYTASGLVSRDGRYTSTRMSVATEELLGGYSMNRGINRAVLKTRRGLDWVEARTWDVT